MNDPASFSYGVYTRKGEMVLENGKCFWRASSIDEADVVAKLLNRAFFEGHLQAITAWQESLNKAQYKVKGAVNATP